VKIKPRKMVINQKEIKEKKSFSLKLEMFKSVILIGMEKLLKENH
jgi:hypothetical protein